MSDVPLTRTLMSDPSAPPSPRRPDHGCQAAFTLFVCLWAAATLFHIASYNQWSYARFLAYAAGWVLLAPGSLPAFATLAAVQLRKAFLMSPYVPNHWLFTAMVNGAMLAVLAALIVKRRSVTGLGGQLYERAAPALRASLVALYFFAAFHKLNTDWFDPTVSCATTFYAAQLERLAFLPDAALAMHVSIYLGIGVEAAIALLLVFRRTRYAGLLVGMAFHVMLAFNPTSRFYNFSALLVALFALFIPPRFFSEWLGVIGRFRLRVVTGSFLGVCVAGAMLMRSAASRAAIGGIDPFLHLWTFYGVALLVLFVGATWRRRAEWRAWTGVFRLPHPALALLPILVCVNGMTPYLGLKTETSWAMFSNLRTEGNYTNHWIVPTRMQIFNEQRDLVQVTRSSDPFLQARADRGELVPYFELRRRPTASVSFIRGDAEYVFDRVSDDPGYPGDLPGLLEKFFLFRPIPQTSKQTCVH